MSATVPVSGATSASATATPELLVPCSGTFAGVSPSPASPHAAGPADCSERWCEAAVEDAVTASAQHGGGSVDASGVGCGVSGACLVSAAASRSAAWLACVRQPALRLSFLLGSR